MVISGLQKTGIALVLNWTDAPLQQFFAAQHLLICKAKPFGTIFSWNEH
jgi:hypothetical protein